MAEGCHAGGRVWVLHSSRHDGSQDADDRSGRIRGSVGAKLLWSRTGFVGGVLDKSTDEVSMRNILVIIHFEGIKAYSSTSVYFNNEGS